MNDEVESNYYPLIDGIQAIIDMKQPAKPTELLSSLRADLAEMLIDKHWDEVHGMLSSAQNHLAKGSLDTGVKMLTEIRNLLRPYLPRFRLVLLNETPFWTDKALVKECGVIWAAYLYDEQRKVHIADTNPSYELHFLYRTPENFVSDATHEQLDAGESSNLSYYCKVIDNIDWDRKHYCGRPQDTAADDYAALVESEIEHYRSNHVFDLPRPPSRQMLISASREQCSAGDYAAAAATIYAASSAVDAEIQALAERLRSGKVGKDIDDAYACLEASLSATEASPAPEHPQG